jgi:hypothetical protein
MNSSPHTEGREGAPHAEPWASKFCKFAPNGERYGKRANRARGSAF